MKNTIVPRITLGIVALVGLLLVGLALFLPRAQSPTNKIKIVAAENFWGSLATQVGGDRVEVTSIINGPEDDPHAYESGAKDASVITNANIVILNGAGYDEFAEEILNSSPNESRVVLYADHFITPGADGNPHLWYDYPRVGLFVAAIEDALTKQDPSGAETFRANAARLGESLQQVLDRMAEIAQQYPGAPVAYTERVAGYLISNLGFTVKSPESFAEAIEAGTEPSPADQAAMLELITKKEIRVLFYNAQAESDSAKTILQAAKDNGVPVVAVTETMPAEFATYQAWQLAQLDALLAALKNSR